MRPIRSKRRTDQQIISAWIGDGQRVLDIGCGRGVLLESLVRAKNIQPLGVDSALDKVQSCIKRGIPVYHGDADSLLPAFDDHAFDWVILSRTVQELQYPDATLAAALRVGRNLAIGFVNHGFWVNRWHSIRHGSPPLNEVFPLPWYKAAPSHHLSIHTFKAFINERGFCVAKAAFLAGDWLTPVHRLPNLRAGYALFHLVNGTSSGKSCHSVK
jgi:methionine biosynthesis protein MetW